MEIELDHCFICKEPWELADRCPCCMMCDECCECAPDPDMQPGGVDDYFGKQPELV